MVIGNGMIARKFETYRQNESYLIFASGVSNSSAQEPIFFHREENLLRKAISEQSGKLLVYFSTCSIYDPSLRKSNYVLHKLYMEEIIEETCESYSIFRVSNPIGKTNNPHTVFNFFIQHILRKTEFNVWRYASRNLLDIDDMYALCNKILLAGLFKNQKVNVANPINYPVLAIVQSIENHFNTKGFYNLVDKGNSPLIDTTLIQPLFIELGIQFDNMYLPAMLQKYFPNDL